RVEHNVDRSAILEEWHVLNRQDLGDDAFVAMPPGELVTIFDLALLSHIHPDQLVDPGRELVICIAIKDPYANHRARLAVRHLERGVADLARLLTEDRSQQPLLRSQFGLALWSD